MHSAVFILVVINSLDTFFSIPQAKYFWTVCTKNLFSISDEKVCALFGSTNKVGALCHPSPAQIENALFELPGQQKAPA